MVNVYGLIVKTKRKIEYPNLESAKRRVPRNNDDLSAPVPTETSLQMSDEMVLCEEANSDVETTGTDEVFVTENEPQKFSQEELNDSVRPAFLNRGSPGTLTSRKSSPRVTREQVR